MKMNLTSVQYPFKILLISDTHLPRGKNLPELLIKKFADLQPDLILHCGDIYTLELLLELGEIAHVCAVRGNRDLLSRFSLPPYIDLSVGRYRILAEHGQGSLFDYFRSKLYVICNNLLNKPVDDRKVTKLRNNYQDYDIYCVGHTHHSRITQMNRTLIINPGHLIFSSAAETTAPGFILITLYAGHCLLRSFTIFDNHVSEGKDELFILREKDE